ncbi:MAG TPA: hypothetical protein G4N92_09535 [Anaerolineae bacterium]|nr:hypothetical protein [Anaerolineae bacterium]
MFCQQQFALCLGPSLSRILLRIWLSSKFIGDRSKPKVAKLAALDEKYRK